MVPHITAYKTPQEFLNKTSAFLEQKELENNLIIGLCNGFPDKTKVHEGCVFINASDQHQIQASSIKTISKAIVSGATKRPEPMKALADYYLSEGITLSGVVGERFCAEAFSAFYGRPQSREVTMLVHQLASVNQLPLPAGKMELANAADTELLTAWSVEFQEDADTFPRQSKAAIFKNTEARIQAGHFFKWVVRGEVVSMAAIVRKTRNIGIVGLVYTPKTLRGKGYATGIVSTISAHILQKGYQYCGLFTDVANPTSNSIYRKIGYVPVTEFKDIEYGPKSP